MKIKYVIIDGLYPVIISDAHAHADVARMDSRVTSAGFFALREEKDRSPHAIAVNKITVSVWGESVSLGIKSKPEDAKILERLFNN